MIPEPHRCTFDYQVIRKPHIRHLYLRIREGKVYVSANQRVPEEQIEQFVRSKSAWIQKHLSRTEQKQDLGKKDARVHLLGEAYPIHIHHDTISKEGSMEIENGIASFSLPHPARHETLVSLRDAYYKKCCPIVITPMVEKYAAQMHCFPAQITYRHNKSRWGSCSAHNRLSLNTRLMMLPKPVIVYVVIHELAHILHKNHAAVFWLLVEKHCPDYKALRRAMRAFESFL